jgi:hypothetical protein
MLLVRLAVLFLLLSAGVSFAFYMATGQERFKTIGLRILKWTIWAAVVFFGLMVFERML